ncbi:putative phosphotransacetylase [Robertmurraya andreesenii]|uniref:Phosphate propanoyltransferase n=2 Tax=Anoxybacillus andreesenii TaxID=1325932 RepID=A0ABT9V7C6_9BACL|nr:phosphate propanoyltransferase [Robertmurraya andreesenii]MDQ0156863.1 putative phosphotransacetylase [Robertmurraya andreesenii]
MNMNSVELIEEITRLVVGELENHNLLEKERKTHVPVSISARHLHLQQEHVEVLFGKGHELSKFKEISQPGQYACNEKVTLKGPKGTIENVRVLGPLRKQTQIEISRTDARKLGISPPVRNSGNLAGSEAITLIGPKGTILLEEGCIIADRHIHMTPQDARDFGVKDKQKVSVLVEGEKGGVMGQVTIRVNERYALDMHIDTDDANAFDLKGNEWLKIIAD